MNDHSRQRAIGSTVALFLRVLAGLTKPGSLMARGKDEALSMSSQSCPTAVQHVVAKQLGVPCQAISPSGDRVVGFASAQRTRLAMTNGCQWAWKQRWIFGKPKAFVLQHHEVAGAAPSGFGAMVKFRDRHLHHIVALPLLALLALLGGVGAGTAQAQGGEGVRVLRSDQEAIVLELVTSAYDAREVDVDGTTFLQLSVADYGATGEQGKPQIPLKGALVGIPPGAEVELRIVADEAETVPLVHPVLPVPTPRINYDITQVVPEFLGNDYLPDGGAYADDAPFPAETAVIADSGTWRTQRYVNVEFHPLQYRAASSELIWHKRIRVELALSYRRGRGAENLGAPADDGPFGEVMDRVLVNASSARKWRATAPNARESSRAAERPLAAETWFKLGVTEDGMYKVTCDELANAAGQALSISKDTIKVYLGDVELAIAVEGDGWGNCSSGDTLSYVVFFGQASDSKYTNENIYWLTFGGANGKRMAARSGAGDGQVPAHFTRVQQIEENETYNGDTPLPPGRDHWFWNDIGTINPQATYPFELEAPAAVGASATLEIGLSAYTTGEHRTVVSVNACPVLDETWSGGEYGVLTVDFDQDSCLAEGANSITLSEPTGTYDVVFVDYFALSYQRTFDASDDELRFTQNAAGEWKYQLHGFTNDALEVFDISDAANVSRIEDLNISGGTLEFADVVSVPTEYLALAASQLKSPSRIELDAESNLRSGSNGADYIIITHSDFLDAVQPLADLRAGQGLRTMVVDVQEVYDEFNSGLAEPEAIREFLQYTYTSWSPPAPWYVLLVGDSHYDPKEYCLGGCTFITTPPNTNLIPALLAEVDPWIGETSSDNQLVALDAGSNFPSMAIGRLPVATAGEADALVSKIVNYEQNPADGDWRAKITFVADNPDGAGDFWLKSDAIADDTGLMHSQFTADKVYYGSCPDCIGSGADVRSAIVAAVNEGRIIVNYVGHGAPPFWASEQFLTQNEVSAFANGSKTPIMLEMTCYTGYFIIPHLTSLAELEVNRADGAVASWAAAGLGVATGHDLLDRGFFDAALNGVGTRIGDATIAGKAKLWVDGGGANRDLIETFHLIGDPAARIAVPPAAASRTLDSEDVAVQYNGWIGYNDAAASGGTYRASSTPNDKATFSFKGKAITWVTRVGPDQGKAQVFVDDVDKGTIDLYSPSEEYQKTFKFGSLGGGEHKIVITVLENKPVSIDAFVVGKTTTQDNTRFVMYNKWSGGSASEALNGSFRSSNAKNGTATLVFTGSKVRWLTATGPNFGKARVTIDGENKGVYDLYSSSPKWNVRKTFDGLGGGTHTLVIQALGKKNPNSTGKLVVVDGFVYE